MIHSRTPSHPAPIQPLPTGATPPPTANRLHGAGSPRERQEATTPQRSTPTEFPFSPHGLSSEARLSSEPSHQAQGFSRPRQHRRIGEDNTTKNGKGEPRTAPPGIETVKSWVCPRTSTTGYPFMDGHQRPGCPQSPATR